MIGQRKNFNPGKNTARCKMISWQNVSKKFLTPDGQNELSVIEDVSLIAKNNEFLSLVGPSGCGKSTLLNIVAGLEMPSSGSIIYKGEKIDGINRDVGYMTQKDTLLPWKTAAENIAIPLKIRGLSRADCDDRVNHYLNLVGLDSFTNYYPGQLSGGMRKRVALARTLIYKPNTLLMDEPFGALDVQIRLLMQKELARVLESESGISSKTVIFVTHDLREAIALSDRVVVFSARPAKIILDKRIGFSRPRDPMGVQFLPEFEDYYRELWKALEGEFGKGTDA